MKRSILSALIAVIITIPALSGTLPVPMHEADTMEAVGMVKSARRAIPREFGGSQGTAFLVAPEYVITAGHCIQSNVVVIKLGDEVYLGRCIVDDRDRDWALVKLDRPCKHIEPLKISRQPSLIPGRFYKSVGFGRGEWGTVPLFFDGETTRGIIVGGMSGGPILNDQNEVVAINTWSGQDPTGFCGGNNPCELDEWLIGLGIIK